MHSQQRRNLRGESGFSLTEMLVATVVLLTVTGVSLSTFARSLGMRDYATQLGDANQNLRAGVNQLVRDIMQAGRIIGPEGVPLPSGSGALPVKRPGPPGTSLTFDVSSTTNLPDITSGYQLGPTVQGQATDIITLVTVDPFQPIIETPPSGNGLASDGTIAPGGDAVLLPAASPWLVGDTAAGTPPIRVGDIILFKNSRGMAMQTVTRVDDTHLYFDADDWFQLNQRVAAGGTVLQIKQSASPTDAWVEPTSLFRLLLVTYYIDVTSPENPLLTRVLNHFAPQSLAGAVENLQFTYDLVDGVHNPVEIPGLPYTAPVTGVVYSANLIRKVNLTVGVRSERASRVDGEFVRNRISTSVDVRSLASVDRYDQ